MSIRCGLKRLLGRELELQDLVHCQIGGDTVWGGMCAGDDAYEGRCVWGRKRLGEDVYGEGCPRGTIPMKKDA